MGDTYVNEGLKTERTLTVCRNDTEHKIVYYDDSIFRVELGKGPKGSYQTFAQGGWKRLSSLSIVYDGLNICNGYKKRFVVEHANGARVVITRQFSL